MTIEELQSAFEMLRADGYSDEDLLRISHRMYADGKIDLDTLETYCAVLGYEFTDEFKAKSEEEKKKECDPPDELLQECGLTLQEARKIVAEIKEQSGGKEEATWKLNRLFVKGKITSSEFKLYCHILGLRFSDEFDKMTEREKKEYCLRTLEDEEDDEPLDISQEEAQKGIEVYRGRGMSDNEMMSAFYEMYQRRDISFESLKLIADLLGFDIT